MIDTSLRELPDSIGPNVLQKFMKEKIETNLAYKHPEPKVTRLTGGGLFTEFEWMPDSYDNCIISLILFLTFSYEEETRGKEQREGIARLS